MKKGQGIDTLALERCVFADRKYDFVYAMRLSPCVGCGGKFIGRDLYTVMGWHESLTFFEGDRLCRALGSRVPLFTQLPRRGLLGNLAAL